LSVAAGPAVEAALERVLTARRADPQTAGTISASDVERLVAEHGLASPRELALLALPVAARLARPMISGYRVGVVGLDDRGDLVLGANLEFPRADLGSTVHAEDFASLRARARGRRLAVLALSEARPCAHCRQTLAESIAADDLELIDPLGHARRLSEVYPWPFTPAALEIAGDDPRRAAWPRAELAADGPPSEISAALVDAVRRAHAPYSRCPSAVALRLVDGGALAAGCVESVSFNPTITATQAALVELAAMGLDGAAIEAAWLARVRGGAVDPEPGARALLRAVAPTVELTVVDVEVEGLAG
jgi:cytidine deaminase